MRQKRSLRFCWRIRQIWCSLAGEPKSAQLQRYSMSLPGLPHRPPKATRLRISLEFESLSRIHIRVTDLGLGELFPASGLEWNETLVQ